MGDLESKKRQRTQHRRLATTTMNAVVLGLVETEEEDHVARLNAHLAILKSKLAALEGLDSDIIALVSVDDLEAEMEGSSKYQTDIHVCIATIENALKTQTVKVEHHNPIPSFRGRTNVNLPKVNIEPFNGDAMSYPTFIDSFIRIIDQNENLAQIEKCYYLRGLLQGKAKSAVGGLTLNENNYMEALELLKVRFGDEKLLQATFIDSLLKLKPTSESKDDSIEKCIRKLKSLGITSESFGPMLIPCILQKLPEEIRLVVTKNLTGDRWDFDEALKLFNNELTAREKCNFISDTVKKDRKPTEREFLHRIQLINVQPQL